MGKDGAEISEVLSGVPEPLRPLYRQAGSTMFSDGTCILLALSCNTSECALYCAKGLPAMRLLKEAALNQVVSVRLFQRCSA